jgi:hypothetical protein
VKNHGVPHALEHLLAFTDIDGASNLLTELGSMPGWGIRRKLHE